MLTVALAQLCARLQKNRRRNDLMVTGKAIPHILGGRTGGDDF